MTEGTLGQLGHLSDAELRYQDGLAPVGDVPDNWQLVGGGTGHVEGPRARGAVRWSNFEQTFEDHCRLNVTGTIQTADGAEIRFDFQRLRSPRLDRSSSMSPTHEGAVAAENALAGSHAVDLRAVPGVTFTSAGCYRRADRAGAAPGGP